MSSPEPFLRRFARGGGLGEGIMSILTSLILESKRFRKNSGKLPPLSESTQELIRSTSRVRSSRDCTQEETAHAYRFTVRPDSAVIPSSIFSSLAGEAGWR